MEGEGEGERRHGRAGLDGWLVGQSSGDSGRAGNGAAATFAA